MYVISRLSAYRKVSAPLKYWRGTFPGYCHIDHHVYHCFFIVWLPLMVSVAPPNRCVLVVSPFLIRTSWFLCLYPNSCSHQRDDCDGQNEAQVLVEINCIFSVKHHSRCCLKSASCCLDVLRIITSCFGTVIILLRIFVH